MTANPGTDLKVAVGWESVSVGHDTIDQGVTVLDVGDPPGAAIGVISGRGGMAINPDALGNTDKAEIDLGALSDDIIVVTGHCVFLQLGTTNVYSAFASLITLVNIRRRNIAIMIDVAANTHRWGILDDLGVVIAETPVLSPAVGAPFSFWFYWITKRSAPTFDFLYVEHLPSGPNRGRTGSAAGGFAQGGFITVQGAGPAWGAPLLINAVRAESQSVGGKDDGNIYLVDDYAVYGGRGMKHGIYAGVVRAKPTADTSEDAWGTVGAGAGKWDRWEEVPSDDAATYLTTPSGAAVRQLSEVQDNDLMVDTRSGGGPDGQPNVGLNRVPIAVVHRIRARSPGATDEIQFRGGIAGGGTLTGPNDTPAAAFRSNLDYWTQEQTPEAVPRDWNPQLINAMEWGVESAGAGVGSRDVTNDWPDVWYEVPRRGLPLLV